MKKKISIALILTLCGIAFFPSFANCYWISNTSGKIDLDLGGFGYPTPYNDITQNYQIQIGYHTNEFAIMGLKISYLNYNEENENITIPSGTDSFAITDAIYNFDLVMLFNFAKIGDRMVLSSSLLPGVAMVTRTVFKDGTSIKQESYTAFSGGFEIGFRIYLTEGISLNAGWILRYMKLKNYPIAYYVTLPKPPYTLNDYKNGLIYTSLTANDVLLDYNLFSIIWSF